MAQQKPWEKDWSTPQQGPIVLGTPNPTKAPRDQAELISIQQRNQQGPYDLRKSAADATKAEAEALLAQQKADQARAEAAIQAMGPNSQLHGDEYLKKFVPPAQWNVIKAYARGDLGSKAGGLTTSMLPIIQHAMNYDPSASGVNFPARVKMQSDLASGDPKSAGGSLQAFERMLLHGENVLDKGLALKNFHSGLAAPLNYPRAAWEGFTQDPTLAGFNQSARNYAPEAQKAIAQVSGGQAERMERHISGASSPESIAAALQADATQAMGAMQSVNDRYKRIMGRDITDILSPDAKRAYDKIMAGGYDPDGQPMHPAEGYTPLGPSSSIPGAGGGPPTVGPSSGGGAPPAPPGSRGGPSPDKTTQFYDPNGAPTSGAPSLASGGYHTVYNAERARQIDGMIRSGFSPERINKALLDAGNAPVDPAQVREAQRYLHDHPDFKGGFTNATDTVPVEHPWLNDFQQSAPGVFLDQLSNAGTFGNKANLIGLIGGNADLQRGGMEQAATQHPYAAIGGNIVGGTAGALGLETGVGALGRAAGLGAKAAPWLARGADSAYGGITAASENPDDPWAGVKGALAGVAGGMFGSKVVAPVVGTAARKIATSKVGQAVGNTIRDFRDLPPMAPPPQPLGSADKTLLGAAEKAGIPGIQAQLAEASNLGVPMSLADTHPALTSLTGAVVRRSPNADALAQGAFIPRARGQIDRFGQAVERDLGPVANVPQLSEDLARQAKAAAAPLYAKAYAANGVNNPEIDSLLATPFGKDALGRARTIAANERVDPSTLGIDLNPQGEPVLTRVPSMQTLDYAKQGMDDVLEQYRNPFGKLQLTPAGNAQNAVKNSLLGEIDRLNPAYKEARAAYAGPMQSRDALALGQDAVGMNPDTLGVGLAGKSPEQLQQVQLGFRSGLMDQGNKVRYSTNPFDATLGTPAAEQRLSTVYPGHPGVPNLLRQRDMENGLARTTNDILGNSKTAQRGIADDAFSGSNMLQTGLDLGINAATGQVPIGTVIKGVGKLGLKDMMKLGVGKRAVAKADALAPLLLNTNPAASSDSLSALLDSSKSYRDFVDSYNRRFGRPSGMFGAALGTGLVTR